MFLQPTCDCQTVTVNYARRHDIVLAKLQASVYQMKSLTLAFSRNNKTSIQYRGFIKPPLLCRGGNSTSAGGFYFVIFALIGAFQPKEVAIVKEGINLYCSKLAFQPLSRKEYLS
jgi:hypothetical protein